MGAGRWEPVLSAIRLTSAWPRTDLTLAQDKDKGPRENGRELGLSRGSWGSLGPGTLDEALAAGSLEHRPSLGVAKP